MHHLNNLSDRISQIVVTVRSPVENFLPLHCICIAVKMDISGIMLTLHTVHKPAQRFGQSSPLHYQ